MWTRRQKVVALVIGGLLVGYLAWMVPTSKLGELRTIRGVAAPFLRCDRDRIEIGWGKSDDGGSEHEVRGCGGKGMVSCIDRSRRHGTLGQYFTFEFDCWFHAPLPSGGYDARGYKEPQPR
jgi:hypothetical protein